MLSISIQDSYITWSLRRPHSSLITAQIHRSRDRYHTLHSLHLAREALEFCQVLKQRQLGEQSGRSLHIISLGWMETVQISISQLGLLNCNRPCMVMWVSQTTQVISNSKWWWWCNNSRKPRLVLEQEEEPTQPATVSLLSLSSRIIFSTPILELSFPITIGQRVELIILLVGVQHWTGRL
jgi:hypothetical protein